MQPDVLNFQKMSALDCSWHVLKFQATVLIKSFLYKKECKTCVNYLLKTRNILKK